MLQGLGGPGVAAIGIELGNEHIIETGSGESGISKTGVAIEQTRDQRGAICQRRDAPPFIVGRSTSLSRPTATCGWSALDGPGLRGISIHIG